MRCWRMFESIYLPTYGRASKHHHGRHSSLRCCGSLWSQAEVRPNYSTRKECGSCTSIYDTAAKVIIGCGSSHSLSGETQCHFRHEIQKKMPLAGKPTCHNFQRQDIPRSVLVSGPSTIIGRGSYFVHHIPLLILQSLYLRLQMV